MFEKTRFAYSRPANHHFLLAFASLACVVCVAAGCEEPKNLPKTNDAGTALPPPPAKTVVIYYAEDTSLDWNRASVDVVMLRNFLGHFATTVEMKHVEDYVPADLRRYDVGVYISSVYNYPIPPAFLQDIYQNTDRPFLWIGENISSLVSLDQQGRLGFRFLHNGEHLFPNSFYNGTLVARSSEDVFYSVVELLDDSICEIKAVLTDGKKSAPDVLRCGNFWYMTNNPFPYYESNVFIVADILHDVLRTKVKPSLRALLRLEDISSVTADQAMLKDIADKLSMKGIPFAFGVIPKYVSPKTNVEVEMGKSADFINTLKYLESKGGVCIQHGYTHQYDGLSGEDYEFWDEDHDVPVPEDSYEWAFKRADTGRAIFRKAMGYDPLIWETPHYTASAVDYFAFASLYSTVFEPLHIYKTTATSHDAVGDDVNLGFNTEQIFPFVVFSTQYGFSVLPENLGYIEVGGRDDYGVPLDAEGKLTYARPLKIVRDAVAGFFFHHWQPTEQLFRTIELLENEGYRFVDVLSLIREGPPPYSEVAIESDAGTRPDGGEKPFIECPRGPEVCPDGLGCHDELCDKCTSPDECRSYDGCRADGTCGECESQKDCRLDEECRHGFCMPQVIPSLDITVDADSFADLTADDEDLFSNEYFPCTLKAEGTSYEGCEIRLLGTSSRIYPKKSFRLKFPEDSPHPGYSRKINLKSNWNDPSLMRSFLAFETLRRLTGIPTPRNRYRRVYVNGSYYGLFTEIERLGPKFLKIRNRDKKSSLYETVFDCPSGALIPLPDLETYRSVYQKKIGDENDFSDLTYLIENVLWEDYKNSPSRTQTVTTLTDQNVHTDGYLKYVAAMVAVQNIDNVVSNFHFGIQTLDKKTAWEFFPWDMDISFGCKWDADVGIGLCGCHPTKPSSSPYDHPTCDNSTLDYTEWSLVGILSESDPQPVYPNEVWFNMLTHLLLNSPEHRSAFNRYVCDYLSSNLWKERLPKLIDAVSETIKDAILEDINDLSDTEEDFQRAVQGIRDFVTNRATYVLTEEGEIMCR